MSTRANILLKDEHNDLWFYRHSDGYPSVTAENLKTFVDWNLKGLVRNNLTQASGWLIVLGNNELNEYVENSDSPYANHESYGGGSEPHGGFMGWKVGAYEPTTGKHVDIAFLYIIDMKNKTIQIQEVIGGGHSEKYSFDDFMKADFQNWF